MIQNFSRQTSMYYLLSNNHINDLIMIRFDFGDEEVIAYYISFLKTLSLKLNRNTLQFFFNQAEGRFPLYSQAIQVRHSSHPCCQRLYSYLCTVLPSPRSHGSHCR